MEYYSKLKKEENIIYSETKSKIKSKNITDIDKLVIVFFTAKEFISSLLTAKDILNPKLNNGKIIYYTFKYPNVGIIKYDYTSLMYIYNLSIIKSFNELYNLFNRSSSINIKLYSITALIIKIRECLYTLYSDINTAVEGLKENKLLFFKFKNPFYDIVKTNELTKEYTCEELINLYKISKNKKFISIFP